MSVRIGRTLPPAAASISLRDVAHGLLAMRRKGVRTPDEIAPCTLLWDEEEGCETVLPANMTRYG